MNDIYNYLVYHDKLSSSGMPTVDQMKSIADAGVELVINLAPHDVSNAIPNEQELVTQQYIRSPDHFRAFCLR